MKNYYKILGVKETATEEEIREKWVRLMRKLHPDQRTEGVGEDKRVKEINEAYQILKFSSTRTQYDLTRAYEHKKRRSYARRLSIPISILIILLIMGTVYLKNSKNPINLFNGPNGLNLLNVPNDPNELNDPNNPNRINDLNVTNELNDRNELNDLNGQNIPNDLNDIRIDASSHQRFHESTHDRIHTSTPPRINKSTLRSEDTSTHLRIAAKTQLPNDPITQQPNALNVPNKHNELNGLNVLNGPKGLNVPNEPNDLNELNDLNGQNVPNELNELNDPNVPNDLFHKSTHNLVAVAAASLPMIATEQEIKQFFANYTERYIHKDLSNFLSLFSAKAVQNRQYGLEGIRKIYTDFFNQSKEIKYFLEETRIEFYQNGLEVKARYELFQTLKRGDKQKIWRGDIRWTLVREQGVLKILSLDYQHQKSL
jgi:hypothetical protein